MFFKTKNKENENNFAVFPKVQTAEGWKRMMLKKWKESTKKKA